MTSTPQRTFAVYVSRSANINLRIAMLNSTWGVKWPRLMPKLQVGDRIYFAHQISALSPKKGYPRVKTAEEFEGVVTSLVVGHVTRGTYQSTKVI